MPRKRKKSSQSSRKPPLVFTESPLNQTVPYSSPVLSAVNPVTANTLYVDDLENYPWVSPQFDPNAPPSGGRRRRRVMRDACSQQTSRKSVLPITAAQDILKDYGGRLKLKFIGEETSVFEEGEVPVGEECPLEILRETKKTNRQTEMVDKNIDNHEIQAFPSFCTPPRRFSRRLRQKEMDTVLENSNPRNSKDDILCTIPIDITMDPSAFETPPLPEVPSPLGSHGYREVDMSLCHNLETCSLSNQKTNTQLPNSNSHQMNTSNLENAAPFLRDLQKGVNFIEEVSERKPRSDVLAGDTPADDYGLKVALRRRRDLLPKAAWHRLLKEM